MRRRNTVPVVAATIALAACGSDAPSTPTPPSTPAAQSATVTAGASANTFTPATVTIARGGTVTWTFAARPHTVTFAATAGAPTDVPATTNAQVARTFGTAGTFNYECTIHSGMVGTVVVQ